MVVELLQEKDKQAVCSLLRQCFPNVKLQEAFDFKKIDFTHNIVIVAKIENNIVGHIWIQKQYDFYKDEYYFYLMYICVDENYRHQGVATSMLKWVETLKEKQHIAYITFTSSQKKVAAQALYRKLGYIEKDSSVFIKM